MSALILALAFFAVLAAVCTVTAHLEAHDPRPSVAQTVAMQYLTPEQVAEKLPFGNADWVRQQLRAGRLRGAKVGGRWLAEEVAITEMVEAGANVERRRRRRVS